MDAQDLKSRAGQLLYRELPEEYRYQDPAPSDTELGDLEAFLHSFGHLLDLVRNTTEQAYADSFSETADNDRDIQPWLIPYLAELVGAELRAPDPVARRAELNESVSWFKSKGSLQTVDEISDVVSGSEAVVVEGWRRTLTTPRMALPPFSSDSVSQDQLPQGTPDLRFINRAVVDNEGNNPLFLLRTPTRDQFGRITVAAESYWKPLYARGAPCFPGAYDDTSVRTPDIRDAEKLPGPNPKRTIIHVQPPQGFFAEGINGTSVNPTVANIEIDGTETAQQIFGPEQVFESLGLLAESAIDQLKVNGQVEFPERIIVSGDITLPANVDVVFNGLMFTGAIRIEDPTSRLTLNRCAAERLVISVPTDEPAVIAKDCLFNSIRGGVGFGQLEYTTVMEQTELERLWASDCIFNGPMIDLNCSGGDTCIRYSRVPDLEALADCGADKSPTNTDDDPNFIRLWFAEGDTCVLRPALFGEPGAAVLDLTSTENIRAGAEDEGEMGAYHHLYYAAQIRALRLKLADYLPFGQEIAIRLDSYLARLPAQAT